MQYPRPVLLPAEHGMAPDLPVGLGYWAAADRCIREASSRSIPASTLRIQHNGTVVDINDGLSGFRHEMDAHVERERDDWAAELI